MSWIEKPIKTVVINICVFFAFLSLVEVGFLIAERITVPSGKYLSHKEFRLQRPEPYIKSSYFSADFINESFSQPGGWFTPAGTKIVLPNNYRGRYINVADHKRVTVNQPQNKSKRILIFGGSTIYNGEVPDELTIASQLQKKLITNGYQNVVVENFGASSIHADQQLERLKHDIVLSKNDVVVFYDGVNDVLQRVYYNNPSGFIANQSIEAPYFVRLIRKFKKFSAFFRWIDDDLLSPKNYRLNILSAPAASRDYLATIDNANLYVTSQGAEFLHFLQPTIFTKTPHNDYETGLVNLAGSDMMPYGLYEVFAETYPMMQRGLSTTGYDQDLTAIFNRMKDSPYFDFCHVNEVANALVADAMYERLVNTKILGKELAVNKK